MPSGARPPRGGPPVVIWTWPRLLGSAAVLAVVVALAYGRAIGVGLAADDFQWIDGAYRFDAGRVWRVSEHGHFYRPMMDVYFRAAVGVCGPSAPCLHALNVAAHWATSLAVTMLVGLLASRAGIGLTAGILFAAQPGPVEAVGWISAISEVSTTWWFVVTLILFVRARMTAGQVASTAAIGAFALCLLTHESGATLLPMMILAMWLVPSREPLSRQILRLAPFAALLAGYLAIAVIVNARNYVVTDGTYQPGWHVITNILQALVSMAVARRDAIGMAIVALAFGAALVFGSPRVRFFAAWTAITLLPFSLFRNGLPSRYLYPASVGFAAMMAEAVWWLRARWTQRSISWQVAWAVLVAAVIARNVSFTARNVRVVDAGAAPFTAYAETVRAAIGTPAAGATVVVPPPPKAVADMYVEPLVRWTFRDPTLSVTIAPREPARAMP